MGVRRNSGRRDIGKEVSEASIRADLRTPNMRRWMVSRFLSEPLRREIDSDCACCSARCGSNTSQPCCSATSLGCSSIVVSTWISPPASHSALKIAPSSTINVRVLIRPTNAA